MTRPNIPRITAVLILGVLTLFLLAAIGSATQPAPPEPIPPPTTTAPITTTTSTTVTTTTTTTTTTAKPTTTTKRKTTTTTRKPTTTHTTHISYSEREYVERVVAAEARGESYRGQMLVAQTILDRAQKNGQTPYQVVTAKGQFAKPYSGKVSQSVKDAVAAVLDRGERVTSERTYYFCTLNCHPSWENKKTRVVTEGNHKFFN